MAKSRKDYQGRALRPGESQRGEDKMYIYSYTDSISKKRKRLYAKTLEALRKKEDELKRDQLDGLDIYAAGKSDLNFLFDRYISTKPELSSTTKTNYLYMYNRFVRNGFGQTLIRDIKYSDLKRFYIYLLEEKGLQFNTLGTIDTILHPSFSMGVRDDLIRKNPCQGVFAELRKAYGKDNKRHALKIEEQRAFMNYLVEGEFSRWKPLFTVLLGTGCRVGEVVGLRWEDVDFEKSQIDINHNLTYYPREDSENKCEYRISSTKTKAGIRIIPMMDPVLAAFQEEKKWQEETGIYNKAEVDGMSGFVFCNRYGDMQNPKNINRTIKRIVDHYNREEELKAKKEKREPLMLPYFSCHILRHTFCTRCAELDMSLPALKEIMGHSDISTTMNIYTKLSDAKKAEAMQNVFKNINVF
ncbi:tyrosine-type recombinase/integrase [Anaerotignum sp.]